MSIASNMKEMTLQVFQKTESPSGAIKKSWVDDKPIMISIFDTSSTLNTNNVQYNESTHVGFTFMKGVDKLKNRIIDSKGTIYTLNDVKTNGRLTNLLLKKVVTSGEE